jgi:MFS family permease
MVRVFVPAGRTARVLARGGLIDSAGSGLFLALLPIYLVLRLHAAPVQIGLAVGLANLVGISATVIFGHQVDRFGAMPVWRFIITGRIIGYAAYVFVDSFWQYVVLLFLLVPLDRGAGSVQQAYVVQSTPPAGRNVLMAGIRSARNIGMGVGLFSAGVVAALNSTLAFRVGFALNSLSLVVFLIGITSLAGRSGRRAASRTGAAVADGPADGPTPQPGVPATRAGSHDGELPGPWRDPKYLRLSAGDALMTLHDSVLFTLLPVWLVAKTTAPPSVVGPLMGLNCVLTIALQVPLSRFANNLALGRRMLLRAFAALVATCCLFGLAEHTSAGVASIVVVLGVVALTVGENLHSVASFELSHRLAPPSMVGRYLGVFQLGISVQRTIGPPFMTAAVLRGTAGWLALTAAFGVGTALMVAGLPSRGRHAADREGPRRPAGAGPGVHRRTLTVQPGGAHRGPRRHRRTRQNRADHPDSTGTGGAARPPTGDRRRDRRAADRHRS